MNRRSTQFGVRENTASPRQHASRLAVGSYSETICIEEKYPSTVRPSIETNALATSIHDSRDGASDHAATERQRENKNHLLTVREVAKLLQVPLSWVYGRMRKRSSERLPGYRLGKYWRFREDEVMAWIDSQR
jgi:excisionase family DNA binding protein